MIYYFAYGSNMNPKRMANRVGDFEILGLGTLKDHELRFNKIARNKDGIGYANISPLYDKKVEGIIYRFQNITLLDKSEGYPIHYNRKIMEILHNGNRLETWVYFAQENQISNSLFPERNYLEHLLCGKDYLSEGYFKQLEGVKVIEDMSK